MTHKYSNKSRPTEVNEVQTLNKHKTYPVYFPSLRCFTVKGFWKTASFAYNSWLHTTFFILQLTITATGKELHDHC